MPSFIQMLQAKWDEGKFVCVGLDSAIGRLPTQFVGTLGPQLHFNAAIVEATKDIACAYKPNLAFYSSRGSRGVDELAETIDLIHTVAPDVPVILDAKYGDTDHTNDGYVMTAFELYGADAVTVAPFMGSESLQPFLELADKGIIVLCRTSNKGAGEFQDLPLDDRWLEHHDSDAYWALGLPDKSIALYEYVAYRIAKHWNQLGNCAVVAGASSPSDLVRIREIVGDLPILIPGIGAQGGDLEATVRAGVDSCGQGLIINNSRGIIFASSGEDFAEAARAKTQAMHDAIAACLNAAV